MTKYKEIQNLILTITKDLTALTTVEPKAKAEKALSLVGNYLKLDRIFVFQYGKKEEQLDLTFKWRKVVSIRKSDSQLKLKTGFFKQSLKSFLKEEPVVYLADNGLHSKELISSFLDSKNSQSLTLSPLMKGQETIGLIGFEDFTIKREWDNSEIGLLKILSLLLSQVLINEKTISALKEYEQKDQQTILNRKAFFQKMSHDFRTPLHGLKNALYLLESTKLTPEQKDFAHMASYSTETLILMIDDILDMSKLVSGQAKIHLEVFDLETELVNLILAQQIFAEEKGLNLEFNYDYTINHLFVGDQTKIKQIIFHLLHNAIKYTNQGYVKVRVKKTKEIKTHEYIELTVEDSGIGIEEKHHEKIFDSFYQINNEKQDSFEGTGLGLSVVRELVLQLGASITLESALKTGTTFKINFKLKKDKSYDFADLKGLKVLVADRSIASKQMAQMIGSMHMNVSFHYEKDESYDLILYNLKQTKSKVDFYLKNAETPKPLIATINQFYYVSDEKESINFNEITSRLMVYQKIVSKRTTLKKDVYLKKISGYALIVDDNRLNRVVLENILRQQGIQSKLTKNGFEALSAVQKERFDIVFMDVQMPEIDGIETSKKIRDLGPQYKNLPIIAVTANTYLSDYDLMKYAQMNDVLFKPVHITQLERILRKYITDKKDIFIPQTIVIFDETDFKHRFQDSLHIAKDVAQTFVDTYHSDLKKIKEAIKEANGELIEQCVHYFKGSCSYVSANRVSWLLSLMLDLNRRHDIEQLRKAYDLLVFELETFIMTFKSFLISL